MSVLMPPRPRAISIYDGPGSIGGTIRDANGDPAQRPVVLLLRSTKQVVRRGDSGTDGTYAFAGLRTDVEFQRLVDHDHEEVLRNDRIARCFAGV